jgi:hypothetical protein
MAREPLPDCGDVRLGQGDSVEESGAQGLSCLRTAARSGSGGELKVTYPTVEGDPIVEYFRVTLAGKLEVYSDSTKDTFGSQVWGYRTCGSVRPWHGLDCQG